MARMLFVGGEDLFKKAIRGRNLEGVEVLHTIGGFETMYVALFHQPDKIIILDHTTDMHTVALLKLLHSNVATTTLPVLLYSRTITVDQLVRQGISSNQTTTVTSWDDLITLLVEFDDLSIRGDLLVPALKLSQSYIDSLTAFKGLRTIFKKAEKRSYRKGDRIFNPGQSPEFFYYMYSGQAMTAIQLKSGRRLINGLFPTGRLFGTLSLIIGEPYSQYCEASQDSVCLVAPAAEFYKVVGSNIEFTKGMSAWMTRYTREVMYHAANVAYGNVKQRLANALLRLHRGTHRMDIHINRTDLGAMAGMSKESVVRTLTSFRDEGLIDVVTNRIHILDVPALDGMGAV